MFGQGTADSAQGSLAELFDIIARKSLAELQAYLKAHPDFKGKALNGVLNGHTALSWAAKHAQSGMIDKLIAAGAQVNFSSKATAGRNALMLALAEKQIDLPAIWCLLSVTDLQLFTSSDESAFSLARAHPAVFKLLLLEISKRQLPNCFKKLFCIAAYKNHVADMRSLLDFGYQPSPLVLQECLGLSYAAAALEVTAFLLEKHWDLAVYARTLLIDSLSSFKYPTGHLARLIPVLSSAGLQCETPDSRGYPVLAVAAILGLKEALTALLELPGTPEGKAHALNVALIANTSLLMAKIRTSAPYGSTLEMMERLLAAGAAVEPALVLLQAEQAALRIAIARTPTFFKCTDWLGLTEIASPSEAIIQVLHTLEEDLLPYKVGNPYRRASAVTKLLTADAPASPEVPLRPLLHRSRHLAAAVPQPAEAENWREQYRCTRASFW